MSTMVAGHWLSVRDGDPRARALFARHYSATMKRTQPRRPIGNGERFAGPGEHMVLLTEDCRAVWVWRAERFRLDGQHGVGCSIFRNESRVLSSELIREACELAWQRWPGERLFTYVADAKIRSSNPGYSFKCAGFRRCGRNATGKLTILERLPEVNDLSVLPPVTRSAQRLDVIDPVAASMSQRDHVICLKRSAAPTCQASITEVGAQQLPLFTSERSISSNHTSIAPLVCSTPKPSTALTPFPTALVDRCSVEHVITPLVGALPIRALRVTPCDPTEYGNAPTGVIRGEILGNTTTTPRTFSEFPKGLDGLAFGARPISSGRVLASVMTANKSTRPVTRIERRQLGSTAARALNQVVAHA